jgi:preprotein translocase subunit SecF
MQLFPIGKTYDFMSQRRLFAIVSLFFVLGSIVVLFVPGPNFGTDFRGGTEVEVAFQQATTGGQVRAAVAQAGFSTPDVIKVEDPANPYRFLIRVQEVSTITDQQQAEIERKLCLGKDLPEAECPAERQATEVKFSPGGDKITVRFREAPDLAWIRDRMTGMHGIALREGKNNPTVQSARDHKVEIQLKSKGDQLMDALRTSFGVDHVPDSPLRVEWIGPKAGAQLRDAALRAIAIALVFVMAYIAFRFDLRFAPGAVIALAHDAIATIGVLTVMHRELNLATVAAILTIVGATFPHIINVSLSEMLGRTLLTSGTTIFSLCAFFIWGTGTIKGFALTLIIGLVLGTYSSIYVALPLTEWLDRRFFARFAKKKRPERVTRPMSGGEAAI